MHRLRYAFVAAFLAGILSGCGGESQPNAPATQEDLNDPNFGKNAGDMMKNANTGMNPDGAAPTTP